ncbi:MAG TPA: BACON domain-containing protein, partial [Blastocatellia bacterium]|nr:BACON domain-containing protein [Blastocatellia bacterium]
SRSIWYRFTPATTATYTISTCSFDGTATTVDDTVMAIYTSSTGACGGAFTELPSTATTDGCGDDECVDEALQAVIRTELTAGTDYFIVVWEFDATPPLAGNTAVQLKVTRELPPANDTCAGAIALTLDTPVVGSSRTGSDNYRLSGGACFTGLNHTASPAEGRDVVYTFSAPLPGTYSIRVSDYDEAALSNLVLYTASSCPAAGVTPTIVTTCLAAANRSAGAPVEQVLCQTLAVNQQIYIFVDEDASTGGGDFTIEVTRCLAESEPNDTPATADPLIFGMEGSINPGADADFLSLGTFTAGSRVFAMVEGAASLSNDFDLRVTTATDTLEYDDRANDAPFGFNAPNVGGTILSASPAFLRVDHFSDQASEPYRVYSVVQPPIGSATSETEPNNTVGTADSAANNYFTGTLTGPAPSTDADLFSFTAVAGDIIFLGLDGDPLRDNTPIDASLELLDSNGVQLVFVNDGGLASDTTSGAGSLTATTPFSPAEAIVFRARTTGTYFARVTIGTGGTDSTGAGDYLLSSSRNGRPGSCTFTVSPLIQSFAGMGGNGTINVTTTAGCDWTAVSNDPFITITSGGSGSGNGTVNYSITANPGPGIRSGTITVAGKTFIVRQGIDFLDVPQSHVFYTEIGKLSARGVTLGCDANNYCPDLVVSRDQMAAFILRARGEFNPPEPPTQRFTDTPPANVFYRFIDRMAILQITLGCDVTLYCPSDPVLREQMAAFIIRALGEFNPPEPAMQRFLDVPPTNPFYRFIDRMAVLQITLGCGGGNYCPTLPVSRGQMAAFLVRAFNL